MDEAVINGANLFFPAQFGIAPVPGQGATREQWLIGLVNSAPAVRPASVLLMVILSNICVQLCCGIIGCWLTDPVRSSGLTLLFRGCDGTDPCGPQLNRLLGRRGTIFVAGMFSFITCIWQGLTNSWPHLLVARFFLGLGLGPKSATVPVYSAECAPPLIRGALVMMFQTWTAFGIMFGYVVNFGFRNVPDPVGVRGLNWRLMLGSVSPCAYSTTASHPLTLCVGWYSCTYPRSSSVLLSRVTQVVHDEGALYPGIQISSSPAPYRPTGCSRPVL